MWHHLWATKTTDGPIFLKNHSKWQNSPPLKKRTKKETSALRTPIFPLLQLMLCSHLTPLSLHFCFLFGWPPLQPLETTFINNKGANFFLKKIAKKGKGSHLFPFFSNSIIQLVYFLPLSLLVYFWLTPPPPMTEVHFSANLHHFWSLFGWFPYPLHDVIYGQ